MQNQDCSMAYLLNKEANLQLSSSLFSQSIYVLTFEYKCEDDEHLQTMQV